MASKHVTSKAPSKSKAPGARAASTSRSKSAPKATAKSKSKVAAKAVVKAAVKAKPKASPKGKAPAKAAPKKAIGSVKGAASKAPATAKVAGTGAAPVAIKPVAVKPTGSKSAKSRSFLAALDREMMGTRADAGAKRARPTAENSGPAWEFAIESSRLLRDDKCEDVVMLDVRGMSQITDYVIIGSGTSERQMRSILQHVEELGATRGFQAFRSNTDDRASWVLVDFVDVVVHLFEPNTRAHYDLETLWPEAKRVQWERADQLERDRAGLYA